LHYLAMGHHFASVASFLINHLDPESRVVSGGETTKGTAAGH